MTKGCFQYKNYNHERDLVWARYVIPHASYTQNENRQFSVISTNNLIKSTLSNSELLYKWPNNNNIISVDMSSRSQFNIRKSLKKNSKLISWLSLQNDTLISWLTLQNDTLIQWLSHLNDTLISWLSLQNNKQISRLSLQNDTLI